MKELHQVEQPAAKQTGQGSCAQRRTQLVERAFEHYDFTEFKQWAADKSAELCQQIIRLRTPKCDKEELIRTIFMTEDICCMLRMLLRKEEPLIQEIAEDIYCNFEKLLQEHRLTVIADRYHEKAAEK